MASSGSRPFARLWPFMLSWMTKQARPTNLAHRRIEEYLAGIGMMQANEERRKQGHPVFSHAMILTGLHESFFDDIPHITIAAATDRMREENQHLAIHCQATSVDWEVAQYLGIKTYEENVRGDDEQIRSSFAKPLRTGTSLMSDDDTSARVGCTVDSGPPRWYILNDQQDIQYIEPQTFYTVGEGSTSYLAFLHPILQQPCRASFLGNERPVPHSPDPEPTNLEANMTLLSLESSHRQSVVPYLKFGKDMQRPVRFQTSLDDKVFKTRWESWEFQSAVFRLHPKTANT